MVAPLFTPLLAPLALIFACTANSGPAGCPAEPARLSARAAAGAKATDDRGLIEIEIEIERRVAVMGTTLEIVLLAGERMSGLRASEAALRAIEAAERRLSTWTADSELARLNAAAPGLVHELTPALAADLAGALHWWRATDGAFDPGVGSLVEAWDLRGAGRAPSPAALRDALAVAGLTGLQLEGRRATILRAGLRIEEGAFGKGVGLDAALATLEGCDVRDVLLDLGGQIALHGWSEPVPLAVADPRDRDRPAFELLLSSGSVATSANSERGLRVDGEPVGHLLDPRTGRPAPDFGSLTVIATDATAADCLSTGLFVLGPEAALAFALAHDGVDVLVLEPTPHGLRARASAGLDGRLRPLIDTVTLEIVTTTPSRSPRTPQPQPNSPRQR